MMQHSIPVIFEKYIIPLSRGQYLILPIWRPEYTDHISEQNRGLLMIFPINISPRTTYENCTVGSVPEASQNPVLKSAKNSPTPKIAAPEKFEKRKNIFYIIILHFQSQIF